MIETAIQVTRPRVPAGVISELIAPGQGMLQHPVELLPHALERVEEIAASHRVLRITKGDRLDQERKQAQSGLGDLFDGVEIASHKTTETYRDILASHGEGADRAMMGGNSLRSDVRPAIPITAGAGACICPTT